MCVCFVFNEILTVAVLSFVSTNARAFIILYIVIAISPVHTGTGLAGVEVYNNNNTAACVI